MWVKSSVSCLGAFALDNHLKKGSVFCIRRRVSNLSAVTDLGVGSGVDMMSGVTLGSAVELSGTRHC